MFDRPKGYRGSYKQWEEDNIPPQVVFEIISPGNRLGKMIQKFHFYERHGVEEYYVYNPITADISGWIGGSGSLEEIPDLQNWVSPRLGIRFEMTEAGLQLYRPDSKPFSSFLELEQERQAAEVKALIAQQQTQIAQLEAQVAQQQAQIARQETQVAVDLLKQERERSQALGDFVKRIYPTLALPLPRGGNRISDLPPLQGGIKGGKSN